MKRLHALFTRYLLPLTVLIYPVMLQHCVVTPAHAQAPPPSVTLLASPPPPPVAGLSASNLGNSGNNSYCWWVIPTYPIGDGPVNQSPACLNQIAGPSATSTVTISWPATPSATQYRVLRTTTPVFPNGVCTGCLVSTTTGTSFSDTGAAGTNYTPGTVAGAQFIMALDNLTNTAAVVKTQLAGVTYTMPQISGTTTAGNCASFGTTGLITDSGVVCGGSGGVITGPGVSTLNAIVIWNNITGTAVADSGVLLPTGSLVGTGQANTWTTGAQSFAAATSLIFKEAAGYAPTAQSSIGINTTTDRLVWGDGAATVTAANQGTGTTAGNCAEYDANGALTAAAGPCAATSPTPGYTPNSLISGGGVEWTGLLNFTIGEAVYQIDGVTYSSVLTNVTLDPADGTNPRIDMLVLNSSGVATFVTGTPAASPSEPVVDPSTQLALAFVYVAALATTPTNVSAVDIYRENVEWTTATSGGTINTASLNFPYEGVTSIEGTSVVAGNYVQFTNGSTVNLAAYSNLLLYIRSKASWANAKSLQLSWFSGSTQLGVTVVLKTGQFGFSSAVTGAYQQISIPLSLFGTGATLADRLRITCAGGGGAIGFYLDALSLQTGTIPPSTPTATPITRVFGGTFVSSDGTTALTAGATSYFTIPFGCTIAAWNLVADAGTATVDIWRIATGTTAIPTIANTITGGAAPALAVGNAVHSTAITGWSPTILKNDKLAVYLSAVATATYVNLSVECVQ